MLLSTFQGSRIVFYLNQASILGGKMVKTWEVEGGGARTPPEHHRGSLEQGTNPQMLT